MKLRWYKDGLGKPTRIEKKLRRMVLKLNKFAERHGLTYAELYIIDSDSTRTVNIRAKRGCIVEVNSYAFVKS